MLSAVPFVVCSEARRATWRWLSRRYYRLSREPRTKERRVSVDVRPSSYHSRVANYEWNLSEALLLKKYVAVLLAEPKSDEPDEQPLITGRQKND